MNAFRPIGPVMSFTGATSAPTSVQSVTKDGVQGAIQYVLTNTDGTNDCVVGWSTISDADAKLKAVVASGFPDCYYLLRGTQIVITAPAGAYFTGITASSTAVVKVQAGAGN